MGRQRQMTASDVKNRAAAAKHLKYLLDAKSLVNYGMERITQQRAQLMITHAERLLALVS
jgi:hypothetical protein